MSSTDDDDDVQTLDSGPSRMFRERVEPFNEFSDDEFKIRYRLSKQVVLHLVTLIGGPQNLSQAGSVHDSTIFNDSHVRADFESSVYGSGYLLRIVDILALFIDSICTSLNSQRGSI